MDKTTRLLTAADALTSESLEALIWMAEQRVSLRTLEHAKGAGVEVDTPVDYAFARTRQAFEVVESLLKHGPKASVSPAGIRARAAR